MTNYHIWTFWDRVFTFFWSEKLNFSLLFEVLLLPGKSLCRGLVQFKIHEPYFTAFLRYFLRLAKYDVFIQIEVSSNCSQVSSVWKENCIPTHVKNISWNQHCVEITGIRYRYRYVYFRAWGKPRQHKQNIRRLLEYQIQLVNG